MILRYLIGIDIDNEQINLRPVLDLKIKVEDSEKAEEESKMIEMMLMTILGKFGNEGEKLYCSRAFNDGTETEDGEFTRFRTYTKEDFEKCKKLVWHVGEDIEPQENIVINPEDISSNEEESNGEMNGENNQ